MATTTFNPIFKRSAAAAAPGAHPGRSPSPPRRFHEPLSPAKPKPIEPNFNYPPINHHVDFTVRPESAHVATPKSRNRNSRSKAVHHRTPSTIDTLAEAALAVSPSWHSQPPTSSNTYALAHSRPAGTGIGEPPHKRARSELLPSAYVAQYASRPATSYEYGHGYQANAANQSQTRSYEDRLEEASLLLNFRTGGWPNQSPSHTSSGVPTSTWTPVRPHANSFPRDVHQHRPVDFTASTGPFPPLDPKTNDHPRSMLPSPQQAVDSLDKSTHPLGPAVQGTIPAAVHKGSRALQPEFMTYDGTQQTRTPPDEPESRAASADVTKSETSSGHAPKARRGWPKGKPRGPSGRKSIAEKAATKRAAARRKTPDVSKAGKNRTEKCVRPETSSTRRKSVSDAKIFGEQPQDVRMTSTRRSVPPDVSMIIRSASPNKSARRTLKAHAETVCAGCSTTRQTTKLHGVMDEWISCNGCKNWFHVDCAGFKKASEVRDVDKYFCSTCEHVHGRTTYVRKSTRAHASVDYAELQKGVLKTSEESMEHHYIQPIKDGAFEFDPESFPRMPPELITKEFFERSHTFVEPICIPAEWNPRPWLPKKSKAEEGVGTTTNEEAGIDDLTPTEFEYDTVSDIGQDRLDMVMPQDLTVRQVCNLVGPDTPLDVIDVKTQNSGSKWTLSRWADYYEEEGDDKPIRNVISLEVSHTKLGRLLQRPKVVRDIDLQDQVWPSKEIDMGKWPKVQFYCLMSVADSYTDFHIDFGGSSVYYHILKGKKTFFFIPPKAKHLKAYEEWNDSPQQNYTFLPSITKECYRVDLKEGDTMLIPSGWIHAVWTPETSLVVGGNFLTRMSFTNQFKIVEVEKNNGTPLKFRYPFFQKIMWYTTIQYLDQDPLPDEVREMFLHGKRFERQTPIWADFDGDIATNNASASAKNARYYSRAELDGLPDLVNFIFRTVMLVMGRVEGISQDRMKRVNASIPKGHGHGEPMDVARTFALWVAWKRGNEDPPAWVRDDILPNVREDGPAKKLSARALKEMERKEALAAWRLAPDRQSARVKSAAADRAANASTSVQITSTPDRTTSYPPPPPHQQSPSTPTYAHQNMLSQEQHVTQPMAYVMNGIPGAHISTPKTSVLGPKRVACDACRKRRIRCKHKELVMQATPDQMQQFSEGFLAPELHDSIIVTPPQPQPQPPTSQFADHVDEQRGANGQAIGPIPGTNAYLDANIPMTINGLPMFGEMPKRGRSKACFECRKSKRRCIHDESGNVDPVKAAENPVPRGTATSKKRPAEHEDTPPRPTKKAKSSTPAPPPPTLDQKPDANDASLQPQSYASNYHSEAQQSQVQVSRPAPYQHQQQNQTNLDPSLFAYSDLVDDYGTQSYQYSPADRTSSYQLQSLEQIANEVLDMNGTHGDQHHISRESAYDEPMPNDLPLEESSKPDDTVDSAISLTGSEEGKTPREGGFSSEEISLGQLRPKSRDESHGMLSGEPMAHPGLPVQHLANDNGDIPLYRPPAPISPEQSKYESSLANTVAAGSIDVASVSKKRKRVSIPETSDPNAMSTLDPESFLLAKSLQQDDIGLRSRSK